TVTDDGKQASAVLTVTTGSVHTVTVHPGQSTIIVEGTTGATISTTDVKGNSVTPSSVTWSATGTVSVSPTSGSTTTITGHSVGSGTVTATADGIPGSATVTVNQAPLDHVTATLNTTSVADNGTDFVTARAYNTNDSLMTGQTFTYSSSNTSVATVNTTGTITPLLPGSTVITVTDASKQASATLTVTVGA